MAESNEIIIIEDSPDEDKDKNIDCPICLQSCIHPTRLPCGHIFCFLCVKGVANKNRRCALCRRDIPSECLEHPELIRGTRDLSTSATAGNEFKWFYEGRNGGWWEYDTRSTQELEDAFQNRRKQIEILICDTLYYINFDEMVQFPKDNPFRRRHIKRELNPQLWIKGVAGISPQSF